MIAIYEDMRGDYDPDDYYPTALYDNGQWLAGEEEWSPYYPSGTSEEEIAAQIDGPSAVAVEVETSPDDLLDDIEKADTTDFDVQTERENDGDGEDGDSRPPWAIPTEEREEKGTVQAPQATLLGVGDGVEFVEEDEEGEETEKQGEWQPYQGPQGGEGWQHVPSGRVVYQEEPPSEGSDPSEVGEEPEDPFAEPPDGYAEGWQEAPDSLEQVPEGSQVEFYRDGSYYSGELSGDSAPEAGEVTLETGDGPIAVGNDEITAVAPSGDGETGESEQSPDSELGPTDELGSEWEDYDYGDEKWFETGDYVAFEEDGETIVGEFRTEGASEGLFSVNTDTEDRKTIEDYQVEAYRANESEREDDLDELRQELRENSHVGQGSKSLEAFTDDGKYREFQSQLRGAEEIAQESPFYDEHPEEETVVAALATADEETAQTLKNIQSQARGSLGREITAYRGIDVDSEDFLDKAEEAMESGSGLRDMGFQSTSINEDVAKGFGNVTLEIETDTGVYLRGASEFASEDEVLLPAGTEFKVNGVDRSDNTVQVEPVDSLNLDMPAGEVRDLMQNEGMTYAEAIENVV